jgi:hypothetical protein
MIIKHEGRLARADPDRWILWLLWIVSFLVGALLIWVYTGSGGKTVSLALFWALACSISGGAVGFLFGIPRALQADRTDSSLSEIERSEGLSTYHLRVNTNLEQISDWLTKIIVGLSLVNLRELGQALSAMAEALSSALEPAESNLSFAYALIVFFSITGFVYGYLLTRIYISGALYRSEQFNTEIQEEPSDPGKGADEITGPLRREG